MNPALSLPNALSAQTPDHDAGRRRRVVVLLTAATASAGLGAIGTA